MPNYWLVSAGKDGELWPTFWNEKLVAIGWSAMGDLRRFKSRDALKKGLSSAYAKDSPAKTSTNATQIWNFCNTVRKRELVFVRAHGALIGIAEIQGPYEFIPKSHSLWKKLYSENFDDHFPHIHRVRWVSLWGGMKQPLTFTQLTVME